MRLPRYKGDLVTPASPGPGTAKEQELLAGGAQNRLNETSPRVVLAARHGARLIPDAKAEGRPSYRPRRNPPPVPRGGGSYAPF